MNSTYIIAELSANHGGSLEIALETVRAAKRAGADAIKLQTYTADTITIDSKLPDFKINQGTSWDGRYLYDLYKEASLPWEWHKPIMELSNELGIDCFSSPFDFSAVDFLEELNVPAYKIASFEITDIPLIKYAASKGKPMIISTGIADIQDIELAISACREVGNHDITILKCTSAYPAMPEDADLIMIKDIRQRFNVKAGLSDHTTGIVVPVVSVAMGATVIEKHFILNKDIGGPDSHFSLDEREFKEMVEAVRIAEKSIGEVDYSIDDKKRQSREFSRSLYVVQDIKKGEILTSDNVKSIRPGFGLHPKYYYNILGKKVTNSLSKGTALSWEYFE
ncbi:N-acetylneuraminate synthase [Nonlabens sp. MIC269]|uniref:pseudaminic acid synthase n=1 Tax=Nonlabens sp. MIC269 TaxID=1476901 RepID=UPI0007227FA8|nr:pseudaminic acid synthase [Nonlabens sp. MIC269]ALM20096.1 N-acetylneuraminate synthase [Nonlabens sp. MIC269]